MPSIGIRSLLPIDPGSMSFDENVLLFTTLGLALISFFASTYTTLRTLLPLLPAHPLTRRITGSAVGPYEAPPRAPVEKRVRLKSAQRFTVWLAATDIMAACVLVWEAAFAATGRNGLGGTKGGASRLYLSCAARPTLLLVVATLSYANVVQGRSIALGTLDWIVWLPALSILALGAGLASLGQVDGAGVWVGLLIWSSVVSAIVTLCFGRLLVAILRVRKATQHQVYNTPWGRERERSMAERGTPYKLSPSFLPPLHSNFSGLSTSFIGTVGRSTSTLDLSSASAHKILPNASYNALAVGYAHSRPSIDDEFGGRDFRSPTPGSSHGLLSNPDRSHVASPVSAYSSQTARGNRGPSTPDHHAISFEDLPRPSFGSYASASSYSHAPGFVGGSAVRQAIAKEVWGDTPPPGSGAPKVELSQREARGAVIRIGGHLAGCLLGYAFLCPFLFLRLANPETPPPTSASILLAIAVCQPGVVLAIQCALSEGFWYRTSSPPVLTSSSAATLERIETGEMRERPDSRASSLRFEKRRDSIPGIPPTSLDCDDTRKGRMGRAMSILTAHPKLLILPTNKESMTSGFSSPTTPGHSRLRSLTLSKATITSLGPIRHRSESTASRATVAGFEHSHSSPIATHRHSNLSDELVTRSLLASRKASWNGSGRVPFGFGSRSADHLPDKKRTPSPSPTNTVTSPAEFGFNTREFSLSPAPPPRKSTTPTDYSIDFLSSQLLPRLVPSVKVGRNTRVESESAPLHRRRSSAGTAFEAKTTGSLGRGFAPNKRSRNHRNLSLPGILQSSTWVPFGKGEQEDNEAWIEVETQEEEPPSELASITEVVRGHRKDKSLRRRSWKDRTAKAWDRVEEQEATSGRSTSMDDDAYRRLQMQTDKAFTRVLRLASAEEEDESEILDEERDFADESSGDESAGEFEDYRAAKRSVSPAAETFSPVVAAFFQPSTARVRPAESVGSQVPAEDEELGVVQCATIRPVSRVSNSSELTSTSGFSLRPTHRQSGSVSSSHSRVSSSGSITSPGFLNLLATQGATWHAREDAALSSSDEISGAERSPPRRNSATRPLALLNQRDPNVGTDSSASEKEDAGAKGKAKAKTAKAPTTRTASFNIAPPPIPTIEEDIDGEDKRSGTPTPRASRHRPPPATTDEVRTSSQQYLPNLDGPNSFPMSSTPPTSRTTTPPAPFITTRSRARQHHLDGVRRSSRGSGAGGDENAAPPVVSSSRAPAASGRSAKTLR